MQLGGAVEMISLAAGVGLPDRTKAAQKNTGTAMVRPMTALA
jgi:hypothetical protein